MWKIIGFFVGFTLTMILSWYGGIDFNERGFPQAWFTFISIMIGIFIAINVKIYEAESK